MDYAEACNELVEPISASLHPGNTALFEEMSRGGEPLTTLCPIWPTQDLNLKPPAPETNALPLDQLAGMIKVVIGNFNFLIVKLKNL